MCSFWEGSWPCYAPLQVIIQYSKLNECECFAYWKEGGLESPMPPVLSAGGGGRGGGGGEGWVVVSTGGTTATGGSAVGVSEDTNWKKKEKTKMKRQEQKGEGTETGYEASGGKKETKYAEWREIGTKQVVQIEKGQRKEMVRKWEEWKGGEGRRWRVEGGNQVRCQLLWHTNTVLFSDGRLKGILKCYPTLNLSLFIIQQSAYKHTHTQLGWMPYSIQLPEP